MKDRVVRIVSQIMNVPITQLDMDSSPDTIENWDSLKHMSLILAMEEEFATAFSDDEVVEMLSIKKIIETLKKKELKDGIILP